MKLSELRAVINKQIAKYGLDKDVKFLGFEQCDQDLFPKWCSSIRFTTWKRHADIEDKKILLCWLEDKG